MAADGDCHHLCKLMAPVRHRWSINDVIGGIRNTVMPSDCSPDRDRWRAYVRAAMNSGFLKSHFIPFYPTPPNTITVVIIIIIVVVIIISVQQKVLLARACFPIN
ncbi:hypothetical protein ANN_21919 [Periplaneta americana]|uniref:Uncharacterized protein n=1 Tax=Periplaneta americana TaxID=6978 RepID=A0ABQ8S6Y3_PERAM|nr:hypothetical protein ANN_21919 [Periplaneta americana]